jgi:hypothetical protein
MPPEAESDHHGRWSTGRSVCSQADNVAIGAAIPAGAKIAESLNLVPRCQLTTNLRMPKLWWKVMTGSAARVSRLLASCVRLCNSVPVLRQILGPVTAPAQALLDTFQKWRLDNLRYLIDVIITRLQVLGADLTVQSEHHKNFIRND